MMDRVTLKEYAKARVSGRRVEIWKALIFTFLGSMLISFIVPTVDYDSLTRYYLGANDILFMVRTTLISSLITTLCLQPLTYGVNQYLMDFDKNDYGTNETIFAYYKNIIKIFVLTVFISLVTQCFSVVAIIILFVGASTNIMEVSLGLALPLIVIGQFVSIYLSFCFVAVPYIFKENKDKSIVEIMKLSNQMMKGHKFEYFVLTFSFIGWYILSICTCGFLFIWVLPYSAFTEAKYFLDLKEAYYGISTVDEEPLKENSEEDPFTIG